MASAITDVEKLGPGAFKYTYTGTAPFTLVIAGEVVEADYTPTEYITFNTSDNEEPPALEVFDSTEDYTDAVSFNHPPYVIIQWFHEEIVGGYYKVEVYNDGTLQWDALGNVYDFGTGYHTFKAAWNISQDIAGRLFRVTAVDIEGNSSEPTIIYQVAWFVPDVPSYDYTYTAGTNTIDIVSR